MPSIATHTNTKQKVRKPIMDLHKHIIPL